MADGLFSSHTLTPPTTEEDRVAWLRLIRSHRVGVATFYRLMAEYGSAPRALEALPDIARAAGADRYTPFPADRARQELSAGRAMGARPLFSGAADYPEGLREIADAPPFLWALGDTGLLRRPLVALVGARNASSLGLRMARRLAGELAEAGVVVVSGLARGIDTAAHEAALQGGTIAVQAGGIDIVYPAENAALMGRIGEQGLRLAEQPLGMEPLARHFPMRNRLISGLSMAVVVVEAAAKSGSLLTARMALDQGREVMAVPGHPFDARASGCNMLIRDGAALVRGAEDVLAVIGERLTGTPAGAPSGRTRTASPLPLALRTPATPRDRRPAPPPAPSPTGGSLPAAILARLGPSPLLEDHLIRDLALPVAQILPELVVLELDGLIVRQPGGFVSLAV